MYVCMYTSVYTCVYICMYVYMYVCMYVCIYINVSTIWSETLAGENVGELTHFEHLAKESVAN